MFARVTCSLVPTLPKPCHNIDLNRRCKRHIAIKKYYDKRAHSLQPQCVGDRIMFQSPKEGWQKGQIVRKLGARTYIIRSSLGVLYKHNRVHIRPDRSSTCDVVFNPSILQHVTLCLAHPHTLVSLQVRVHRLLSTTQLPMRALRDSKDHRND